MKVRALPGVSPHPAVRTWPGFQIKWTQPDFSLFFMRTIPAVENRGVMHSLATIQCYRTERSVLVCHRRDISVGALGMPPISIHATLHIDCKAGESWMSSSTQPHAPATILLLAAGRHVPSLSEKYRFMHIFIYTFSSQHICLSTLPNLFAWSSSIGRKTVPTVSNVHQNIASKRLFYAPQNARKCI